MKFLKNKKHIAISLIVSISLIASILILIAYKPAEKNIEEDMQSQNIENSEVNIETEWTLRVEIDEILPEEGIALDLTGGCNINVYDLDDKNKLETKDFTDDFKQYINTEGTYECSWMNVHKIESLDSIYILEIRFEDWFVDYAGSYEDILVKFDAKNLEFGWYIKPKAPHSYNFDVIDNYFILHSPLEYSSYNFESGELIRTVNFGYELTDDIAIHYDVSSFVKKIEDKIYLYAFTYDRYISVDVIDGKVLKHITITGNMEHNASTFEWKKINSPYFRLITDRLAFGGDDEYLYIVDLIAGKINHKLSKKDIGAWHANANYSHSFYYEPYIYQNNLFVYTSEDKTFVINLEIGKFIKKYDMLIYKTYEVDEGLLFSDGRNNIGIIDKDNFEFIWLKTYDNYSHIIDVKEDEDLIIFTDSNPDIMHCYDNCQTPRYWRVDLKTGNKIKEIEESDTKLYHCDYISNDLCLVNNPVVYGDGGYRGFDLYNLKTGELVYKNEALNKKSYLYKDMIIFTECRFNGRDKYNCKEQTEAIKLSFEN